MICLADWYVPHILFSVLLLSASFGHHEFSQSTCNIKSPRLGQHRNSALLSTVSFFSCNLKASPIHTCCLSNRRLLLHSDGCYFAGNHDRPFDKQCPTSGCRTRHHEHAEHSHHCDHISCPIAGTDFHMEAQHAITASSNVSFIHNDNPWTQHHSLGAYNICAPCRRGTLGWHTWKGKAL